MSYIESLLNEKHRIKVPCQTDFNQSSWCAALFGLNYNKLIQSFISDKEQFYLLYKKYIDDGEIFRKEYGTLTCGENINNKILIDKLKLNSRIFLESTYEQNESKANDFLKNLSDDLKNEFYSKKYSIINNFSNLSCYKFVLISSHSHSFAIITFNDLFLILDPHTNITGLMTKENTYNYIKYCNAKTDDYIFITILYGA